MTHGDEYTGPQPCMYALGVYDKASGRLQLAPVAGGRVLRLEPRLHALKYEPTNAGAQAAAPDSREHRLAANKQ